MDIINSTYNLNKNMLTFHLSFTLGKISMDMFLTALVIHKYYLSNVASEFAF